MALLITPWSLTPAGSTASLPTPILATVKTASSNISISSLTIPAFATPASVRGSCALIVGVGTQDTGAGAGATDFAWNGGTGNILSAGAHSTSNAFAGLLYIPAPALGVTDDIVISFDLPVLRAVASAYIVDGFSGSPIQDNDAFAEASNAASITLNYTSLSAATLALSWVTHVFTSSSPDPAATGTGHTEVMGAQVSIGSALIGTSGTRYAATPAAYAMGFNGLDSTVASAVEVAAGLTV